ncbi:lipoyl synthase [Alcanivorax jadensis T9]|jgi:lipoic acid synthetase|uniref:Lipoyl synthase n=1 Tax=Alcanivorax jadensis T9 TaxID=1177181 RepID=A0ABR4W985_9GAMM|nr:MULTISPECIES: lipoyl synthase [Alcanivorax]KGD59892.1 lipoyl synthase [Alcanivorax jadensis T9]MAC13411.1 lipoyl synthase [Alcanivorax sp.]MBG32430.1 lipoyl synthase [Alcanivorax sp.]MBP23377.1 lipoyl synthase [Alcanivorax sp.]MDF1638939.1 lipoyl synthase [Alcanivorax jadensis]|tara:strand:+ start:724 stop:1704 length:981 start_codon:yes stop_codon:yes gene_type:complete
MSEQAQAKRKVQIGDKLRGADKVRTIPMVNEETGYQRKPDWIRVRVPANGEIQRIKSMLREQKLHTVCEEAACPNLPECFGGGTATFMIMGDICTRRCAFCDVGFGRPNTLDPEEPLHLAESVDNLGLKYVVITSVDRDDLADGGAEHFAECIRQVRSRTPQTKIEILTPDFRPCLDTAVDILVETAPDVFNHNIETVPELYKHIRPGARYQHSLDLLQRYKARRPDVSTKSGIMVGLGETYEQVINTIKDLRAHDVDMLTIGQYLQPSKHHAPVDRFVHPDEFRDYARVANELGFRSVASGPMVRSSYHADLQHKGIDVGMHKPD